MGTNPGKHWRWRNGQASDAIWKLACGRGQSPGPRPPSAETANTERWRTAGRGPDGKNQACQQQEAEKLRKGGGGAALNTKQEILKILYTNIQSVFSKINELAVQAVDQCPDIILLTETWCNASTSNATLAIPGYQLETELRTDRIDTANGIGGGLLVYIKLGLRILPCDKFRTNEFNQFCCFKLQTRGEPLTIVLVYRPPKAGYKNTENLCNILKNLEKHTIIVGDFNLPDINWIEMTSATRGRPIMEVANEENLEQMVYFPTHTKGNTLDLILTNCPEKIISVQDGGRIGKSDHHVLNIEVEVKMSKKDVKISRTNWTKADVPGLRKFLGEVNWQNRLAEKTVEETWETFRNVLDEAITKFVPSSTIRAANTPKWLTREIVKLVRKKKRAWKLAKTHGTLENMNHYKKLEKEVIVKIKNAKRGMEKS